MKKAISFIIALAIILTGITGLTVQTAGAEADASQVVSVSDDGLHMKVDFTKMEPTDKMLGEIEPDEIGAIDIDINYQIAKNGDDGIVLYTINGYDPAWIIYEINAPKGQVLDTLKLTIVGRICDYSPIANGFAVFATQDGFTGKGESCELNRIPANERNPEDWEDYAYYVMQADHGTMPTSGSVTDVHEFDLTEAAKGGDTVYIGIYQFTTNCPEWIEYRSLSIDATAVDKEGTPAVTDEPAATEEPAVTEEPAAATDAPIVTDKPAAETATQEPSGNNDDQKKSNSAAPIVIGVVAGVVVIAAAVGIILSVSKKKK